MADERVVTAKSTSRPETQRVADEKEDWRLSFGFWSQLDVLYRSFPPPPKPRRPVLPLDSPSEWNTRLVPDHIDRFLGNPPATACLQAVANSQLDTPLTVTNFVISGGDSTGKSCFAALLRQALEIERSCRFATLDAGEFAEKALPGKLEDSIRRLDASKTGTVSFLTIEHFECVTPSVQQHFFVPLFENANRKSVFLILLVCPDANKLAEQIKMQATKVHLHPLSAELVRTKLLLICQQERVGYTREGLEELAKRCDFKLMSCLEKLHAIFLAHYFISYANVLKVFLQRQPAANNNSTALTPAVPPFPLSIVRMSEPLRRCPKCTLVPPCSHLPLEKLFVKIERMRALYPRNGLNSTANPTTGVASAVASSKKCDQDSPSTSGSTICPSFRRRGVCSNIRTLGRCRYAHPLALHTVDTNALVSRCRAHTLPLPCLHCSNVEELTAASRKERMVCEQLKRGVLHNRQALVDLETQRFMFVRDRGKAVKWGSAKKEADEQLAKLDTELHEAKVSVKRQEQKLSAHQIALVKLQDDAVHGRSHGCGKGNGRLQPERSEYREVEARAQHRGGGHKKKSAVIAAV